MEILRRIWKGYIFTRYPIYEKNSLAFLFNVFAFDKTCCDIFHPLFFPPETSITRGHEQSQLHRVEKHGAKKIRKFGYIIIDNFYPEARSF